MQPTESQGAPDSELKPSGRPKGHESGEFGEQHVAKECACPRCKRSKTLRRLPTNFKCADVVCDFCGYLAQVKTKIVPAVDAIPKGVILGAAWQPQKERMDAGIYIPLYLVLVTPEMKDYGIYYLSADLQQRAMFKERAPLPATARRAGWQGFVYDLEPVRNQFVRLR